MRCRWVARDQGPTDVIEKTLVESSRGGTRTPDPPVNSRLLYQLSYSGMTRQISSGAGETSTGLYDGGPVSRRLAAGGGVATGRSAATIPSTINAPPSHCNAASRSPRSSQAARAANRGSKQKKSAARAADLRP